MTNDDKISPEDIEMMKQAFKEAGMSDAEVSGAIADIWTMDEVAPINSTDQQRGRVRDLR
jgi:hypothetical protein